MALLNDDDPKAVAKKAKSNKKYRLSQGICAVSIRKCLMKRANEENNLSRCMFCIFLKFMFSKKATQTDEIFTVDLTFTT